MSTGRIRIGCLIFRGQVCEVNMALVRDDDTINDGMARYEQGTLSVRSVPDINRMRVTALHELIHALHAHYNIDAAFATAEDEENYVGMLAPVLTAALLDSTWNDTTGKALLPGYGPGEDGR